MMRQANVIDYLAAHGPTAPAALGRALAPDAINPNRAGQSILARLSRDGLVAGHGRMAERRYELTPQGLALARQTRQDTRQAQDGAASADRDAHTARILAKITHLQSHPAVCAATRTWLSGRKPNPYEMLEFVVEAGIAALTGVV